MRHRYFAERAVRGDDKGKWTYICRKCNEKIVGGPPPRYGCKGDPGSGRVKVGWVD